MSNTNRTISRPAVRYFGGKWRSAPWIISHFPPHTTYVEPFGGAMSVLIQKPRSFLEVYNDLNKRTVNFFRILREQPAALVRVLHLTPYSRYEYQQAMEQSPDPLEDARRFVIIAGQGNRGAGTNAPGGWRWMKTDSRTTPPSQDFYNLDHLYAIAERLQGVQIENDDALHILKNYDTPETLYYIDPPYVFSTRCVRWQGDVYNHDMNDTDHETLARAIQELSGMVILSCYPSPLYDTLYTDWKYLDHTQTLQVRRANQPRITTERLYFSPNITHRQLPLF